MNKAFQGFQVETGWKIGKYQAEATIRIEDFKTALGAANQAFATDMQEYTMDLQTVTSNNQTLLSQFGAEIQNYQAKMGKLGIDYQWIQGRMAYLKQHYDELFGILAQAQG